MVNMSQEIHNRKIRNVRLPHPEVDVKMVFLIERVLLREVKEKQNKTKNKQTPNYCQYCNESFDCMLLSVDHIIALRDGTEPK